MKDCVSLEVAQKLQKAGWKGGAEYRYELWGRNRKDGGEYLLKKSILNILAPWMNNSDNIPAPTATQLAEELPEKLEYDGKEYGLRIKPQSKKNKKQWQVKYVTRSDRDSVRQKGHYAILPTYFPNQKTLPDALGLMMEYLLIKKLI